MKNPVAKNMEKFNRPTTQRDKTKYRRQNNKKALKNEGFCLTGVMVHV